MDDSLNERVHRIQSNNRDFARRIEYLEVLGSEWNTPGKGIVLSTHPMRIRSSTFKEFAVQRSSSVHVNPALLRSPSLKLQESKCFQNDSTIGAVTAEITNTVAAHK